MKQKWHLEKIPRTLHTYWGGGTMPYIRMLTIKSFQHFNPDWRVILWMPTERGAKRTWETRELNYPVLCEDCFHYLDVEKKEVDFTAFGFENSISEVHKSDFLRLQLLATMGGVWSDMDIIYFKPIEEISVNVPENKDKEVFMCISHYGHSAGFLMASPNNAFFRLLAKYAQSGFDPKLYQGINADMLNKNFRHLEDIDRISPAVNIPMDAVYAHDAMKIPAILDGTPAKFTNKSIAIHWYAGYPAWGEFIKQTNGGKSNLPPSVISDVLKSVNYV